MKFLVSAVTLMTALSVAAPASANWQYTRFGMTPQQVIQASGGSAWAGQGDQSAQQDGTTADVAGTYNAGGRPFTAKFYFRSGGLDKVVLESRDQQVCAATVNDLQAVYGSPFDLSPGSTVSSATWLDRAKGNRVKIIVVSGMYCELQYSALASGAASGL